MVVPSLFKTRQGGMLSSLQIDDHRAVAFDEQALFGQLVDDAGGILSW